MKCDICQHSVGNNSVNLKEHMERAHPDNCGKCGSSSTILLTIAGRRVCWDRTGCERRRYERGILANAIVSEGEMAIWRNFYLGVREMENAQ